MVSDRTEVTALSPPSMTLLVAAFLGVAGGVEIFYSADWTWVKVTASEGPFLGTCGIIVVPNAEDEPLWSTFPFPFSALAASLGMNMLTSSLEKALIMNELSSNVSHSFSAYACSSLTIML